MASSSGRHQDPPLPQRHHFIVIVLGDLGRSPRMQYHALSLLKNGQYVSMIGYAGEKLIPAFSRYSDRLNVIHMQVSTPPFRLKRILPLYYIWRILSLVFNLLWAFWNATTYCRRNHVEQRCVLVQNPPAIPLLLVSFLYCRLIRLGHSKTSLVIDWHNLGYSMFPSGSVLSKLTRLYEAQMAPLADGHLCVTSAMKEFVVKEFGVATNRINVLYDCPPSMFQPISLKEQHEFFRRIQLENQLPSGGDGWITSNSESLFTEQSSKELVQPQLARPALVVSSTSWTPDEDFGLLLDALQELDSHIHQHSRPFRILVVVTGKGPLKEYYQEEMEKLTLHHVRIMTLWLEHKDYPLLLACADLGVSLHTSTSGLDLPMKILDLFGCHVPVCAKDFACLSELVQDKVNGRVFETASQLTSQLFELLEPLGDKSSRLPPHGYGELKQYSSNLQGRTQWDENWDIHALPIVLGASSREAVASIKQE